MLLGTLSRAGDELSLNKIIIDAGHGGNDPGAVSADRKTYEKTITLDIARRLGEDIKKGYPEVRVVLTRNNDTFVSLNDRADKANANDGQLFISIHINASKSSQPNGYSIHVLGQSSVKNRDLFAYNMDVCRRENSVILLEDDYSTKYQGFDPSDPESFIFMQLMQNSFLEQSLLFSQMLDDNLTAGPIKAQRGIWQDPFYVLWRTSMPAVLVELGFISNSSDLATLKDSECRQQLADCLFEAFKKYKAHYDASISASAVPAATPSQSAPVESAVQSAPVKYFGTQILAGKTKLSPDDPQFLGYTVSVLFKNGLFKYIIGVSEDRDKAQKEYSKIRKKYPSSFFVEFYSTNQ